MTANTPKPEAKNPWNISPDTLARAKERPGMGMDAAQAMFRAAEPPPGVVPKGHKLAMDGYNQAQNWGAGQMYNVAFSQGYTFLGYAYLSELAQIPEFRLISEVIATEATRRWIKIQSTNDTGADQDAIKELNAEFDRLKVREAFKTISEQDGWFGRSHLYIDTGSTDDRPELKTPIGDGTTKLTARKFKIGELRAIKPVEPVWAYPTFYNATDPLKDDWYNPDEWFVMAKEIHSSRFLTFVARPVPDLFKPAFSFGGLSLTQMAKPYVDNWLQTRQSVNSLIQAFSTMVLKTDMGTLLQGTGEAGSLFHRADLFNDIRNNRGLMMINKDTEDFSNVSVPLGSLPELQAQAQEHICSVSRIPLIKYTGISPSGLNASSEGEIRAFYDTIHAYQENFFSKHLWTIFRLAQINLWGEVNPNLIFVYEPLWEQDELEVATRRKTEADIDALYIDKSILAPEEVRARLARDPEEPYGPIDSDLVPTAEEPLQEHITETQKDDLGGEEAEPAHEPIGPSLENKKEVAA